MSELISGKDALIALANGESVQCANAVTLNWSDVDGDCHIDLFTTAKNRNGFDFVFRLKPRTITLNGIEVPAPFEPKEGETYWCFSTQTVIGYGHNVYESERADRRFINMGAWRTEEEIKRVVSTLRSAFKGGV